MWVEVCGRRARALVDTGCSRTILSPTVVKRTQTRPAKEQVMMMSGDSVECKLAAVVEVIVQRIHIRLDCLVANVVAGYDVLLGMDAVTMLGGVQVGNEVRFLGGGGGGGGEAKSGPVAAMSMEVRIDDDDFAAVFAEGAWTVTWKWLGDAPLLSNRVPAYRIPREVRNEYDAEVQEWINAGWLRPYSGEYEGLIPLMAVTQPNKEKVRPVLDFRELNQHISSHTANSEVCGAKLRAWRRLGNNLSIVDLRKAYLQVHVDSSLWRYQVVEHKGRRYCLTRLGFGLNVAPKIMAAIVNKVLSMDGTVRAGTDSFVDDIAVNNDVISNERVINHLKRFGLESKPAESLEGGRVLGLRVENVDGQLVWKRDNTVEPLQVPVTKRKLFSWCGQLTGHFPVAGWLRPACSFLKRQTNSLNWDEAIDSRVHGLAKETQQRVQQEDPVRGIWQVPTARHCRVWCDASSLAIGVALEAEGKIIEDSSWLRKENDAVHINLAELDAILKGLNLALSWEMQSLEIMTDSSSVCSWLQSLLGGDRPVRVRGMGEALVRRRLSVIEDVVKEYGLKVTVTLVKTYENKADILTRVPQRWLASPAVCAAAVKVELPTSLVKESHEEHHLGVDRTLNLARRCYPGSLVSRRNVEEVVQSCLRCRSIDPAPIHWQNGTLEVERNWWRLACDVTHYGGAKYLTVIDCGPSRFAVWKRIENEGTKEVTRYLDEIFREHGPPWQLLLDNGATFRSGEVNSLCTSWGVDISFRCAYRPSGNGIIERNHRTIKRMAARSGGNILRMVYWYNMAPKEGVGDQSAPSHCIFTYDWKPPRVSLEKSKTSTKGFSQGQEVLVKPPVAKCTSQWTRGVVTGSGSPMSVEVDGIPRHIADVRSLPEVASTDEESIVERMAEEGREENRTGRLRQPPRWLKDYVME